MELIIIIGIIIILLMLPKKQKAKEVNAIDKVSVGQYLIGLPKAETPLKAECLITEKDFIFISSFLGDELGRIPRDSINQILIEDKTQITQRLTVTRILTLGIFSLAVPKKKKHKEYCLMIDWEDDNGVRYNTIFEFSGTSSSTQANKAYTKLSNYQKQKKSILKPDEQKCPFCAEIIKKDAKICRFCKNVIENQINRNLPNNS